MVRPIYAHEMCDPDFSWLINTFRENNPDYMAVESSCLPVVLINFGTEGRPKNEFEEDQFEELAREESELAAKERHKGP